MVNLKVATALGVVLAVAATLVGCTSQSATESGSSTLQEVLKRGTLIVGTGSTNPPWHFKDANGQLEGMDIAMGRILAKALFDDPNKVKFVQQSPDARIPNLITKKVDISIQFMTISPERLQQVAFSVPYYTEGTGLLLPHNGAYKSYDELVATQESGKKIKIAILQNVYAGAIVQQMLPGAEDMQFQDVGLIYQALDSGRADAGAVDDSSVRWLSSQNPDKYIDSKYSTYPQNYGAAMRPGDQQWINFVNGVFIDAMTGATYPDYNAAFEKYFGEKLPAPRIGMPRMFSNE